MALDQKLFTVEGLLGALINERDRPWIPMCEIVPEYMPPFPRTDTKPRCVVRFVFLDHRDDEISDCFLRHSAGPRQGHFWDMYGDDYQSPELALRALLEAPPPPPFYRSYFSHKFSIPLGPKT